MEEEIKGIVDQIAGDLKKIAKKHGSTIVLVLVGYYLWQKIKSSK